MGLVRRAAAEAGIDADAAEKAAESAGLIEVSGGFVRFRHPLKRAAVYHGVTDADRRRSPGADLRGPGNPAAPPRRVDNRSGSGELDRDSPARSPRSTSHQSDLAPERLATLPPPWPESCQPAPATG